MYMCIHILGVWMGVCVCVVCVHMCVCLLHHSCGQGFSSSTVSPSFYWQLILSVHGFSPWDSKLGYSVHI